MLIMRTLILSILLAMMCSCVMADTIVYQEDFSNPFTVHDWVYNNSGSNNASGADGQPWSCYVNSDGWPLPNHLSYPSGPAGSYWSDAYNHWSVGYGEALHDSRDIYDWMNSNNASGQPVNTDPTKASCYQGTLPAGWTAAFGMWGDWDPNSNYYSSGRGKMGFSRYMGAYAEAPNDPCLHMWSSSGDMRIATASITSGPGVYTLSWKAGVWNGNTSDPTQQYKWTDWCAWGYGYTNWSAFDTDDIAKPPYASDQVNQIDINRFWRFSQDPFHVTNPAGEVDGRPASQHPANETPGQWHSFSRTFAFGNPPVKKVQDPRHFDPGIYEYNQAPGYFIGFNVGHAHDSWNKGYKWSTIVNVDDMVLTKKDPVSVHTVKNMPIGSLVEIDDMVITNMLPPDYIYDWVDIYLEAKDRSSAIMVRVTDYADVYDGNGTFAYSIGDVVNVVGAIGVTDLGIKYIGGSGSVIRMPAVVKTTQPQEPVKPVAMSAKDVIGWPVTNGISTDSMLVTVYGKTNNSVFYSPGWFFIDDGANIDAGFADYYGGSAKGIKVDCKALINDSLWSMNLPLDGDVMAVTGVLTAEYNQGDEQTVTRVLYPRDSNDLVWYVQQPQ